MFSFLVFYMLFGTLHIQAFTYEVSLWIPFLIQNVIFHLREGGSDNSSYETINHLPTVEKQCNYNLLKVICMENIRSTILTYLNTNSIENLCFFVFAFVFFTISVFFHEHSRITGLQGKGECISLTPHYHFQPLHRHLNISRAIAAESSPLHIVSSRTRTATFGSQAQVANH